jgi:hypothetical protein
MSNSRSIREEDGVKVKKASRPRLQFSKDTFGNLLVKVHPKDKKHLQRFYLTLAELGYDVKEKDIEFSRMGRVLIFKHHKEALEKRFRLVPI